VIRSVQSRVRSGAGRLCIYDGSRSPGRLCRFPLIGRFAPSEGFPSRSRLGALTGSLGMTPESSATLRGRLLALDERLQGEAWGIGYRNDH
jgi:hypothetical protein